MEDLPYFDGRGEPARLFPVLSEKSKEGRTLSAFLAVLAQVREFSNEVLSQIGQSVGVRATVSTFTEVQFPKSQHPRIRPDGLIALTVGQRTWTALVEAKIGSDELRQDQIEAYLALARDIGADAVITISNQYTSTHDNNPVQVNGHLLRSVDLFHFSWFSILTFLNVLSESDNIEDDDHRFLLNEFERFLIHDSAGLKRFTQMGPSWPSVLDRIRSGLSLTRSNDDVQAMVGDWQAEVRDLCLYLTRKTGETVTPKVSKKIKNDANALHEMHLDELVENQSLRVSLAVPNAAAILEIEADLTSRTIRFWCDLAAPRDKKRQSSRVNWLIWQIPDYEKSTIGMHSLWPGKAPPIISTISEAAQDAAIHSHENRSLLPTRFVLTQKMTDGRKFAGRSTFIKELETGALSFYDEALRHLSAWVAPAPKIRPAVEEDED